MQPGGLEFRCRPPRWIRGLSIISSLQRDAPWGAGPAVFTVMLELATEEKLAVEVLPGHVLEELQDLDTNEKQRLSEDRCHDILSRVDVELGFFMEVPDQRSENRVVGGASGTSSTFSTITSEGGGGGGGNLHPTIPGQGSPALAGGSGGGGGSSDRKSVV